MKSFLNLTAFNPHMGRAVCELLDRLGGQASADELKAWLAPLTLFKDGVPPADWGFPYALEVVEHLGLVSLEDDLYVLDSGLDLNLDGFCRAIRARILARSSRAIGNDAAPDPVDDLVEAIVVLMQIDRWPLVVDWPAMQDHQVKLGKVVLAHGERWQVFERWLVFLGFAWRLAERLVPDPTRVVEEHLDALLPLGETCRCTSSAPLLRLMFRCSTAAPNSRSCGAREEDGDVISAPLNLVNALDWSSAKCSSLHVLATPEVLQSHSETSGARIHMCGAFGKPVGAGRRGGS